MYNVRTTADRAPQHSRNDRCVPETILTVAWIHQCLTGYIVDINKPARSAGADPGQGASLCESLRVAAPWSRDIAGTESADGGSDKRIRAIDVFQVRSGVKTSTIHLLNKLTCLVHQTSYIACGAHAI
ncbi:hypothetical protein MAR_000494 [Mya arenaria]|uniref:Uncharacterized protein n=1 Tax=Mya arenaria TaxID=6604 RepID=A0ABY7FHE1_MYAAR|nr:hypothetical protein MAR_000494 [Mya arenaria]